MSMDKDIKTAHSFIKFDGKHVNLNITQYLKDNKKTSFITV